jgi:signal transduction histidine kinase
VSQAAYRILTEALTNVVRHSSGSAVQVRLGVEQGALRCEVVDDGVSQGPWRPGVGIGGMRERVAELGGACEAGPGPRGGTVRFCVPLESA